MKKITFLTSILCLTTGILGNPLYGMAPNHRQKRSEPSTPSSQVEQLVLSFLPKKYHYTGERMEEQTLVIKSGQKYVGELIYTYTQATNTGCIERLFIEKTYRGLGLGSTLMQSALSILEEKHHCSIISLLACPEEKKYIYKLVHFYEQFGFEVDGDGIVDCEENSLADMKKIVEQGATL